MTLFLTSAANPCLVLLCPVCAFLISSPTSRYLTSKSFSRGDHLSEVDTDNAAFSPEGGAGGNSIQSPPRVCGSIRSSAILNKRERLEASKDAKEPWNFFPRWADTFPHIVVSEGLHGGKEKTPFVSCSYSCSRCHTMPYLSAGISGFC